MTLSWKRFFAGVLETNVYFCYSVENGLGVIIDPGDRCPDLIDFIKASGIEPRAVLLTHGHLDHCGGVQWLREYYQLPLMVAAADAQLMQPDNCRDLAAMFAVAPPPPPDRFLHDGEDLAELGVPLRVMATPGHSPGSVVFLAPGLAFTGDTLFQGNVGRVDLPGGDEEELYRSLELLGRLPGETLVLPGHGDFSSISRERAENPYLD